MFKKGEQKKKEKKKALAEFWEKGETRRKEWLYHHKVSYSETI